MTPTEWHKICDEVDSIWGNSGPWRNSRNLALKYAAGIGYRAAMEFVQDAVLDGRARPPSPSEVIAGAVTRGGTVARSTPCSHTTYAIFEYHDDGTASEEMCVGCRTVMQWTAGHVRSVGDVEERARMLREDTNAVAP